MTDSVVSVESLPVTIPSETSRSTTIPVVQTCQSAWQDSGSPSPWGVVSSPENVVSLTEVMSEELAKDLQDKEDMKLIDEAGGTDGLLSTGDDISNDELIAKMLQMQFDKEYDDILAREENQFNRGSKVGVSFTNYKRYIEGSLSDSDEDYLEVDDKKRNWDTFEAASKETPQVFPKCGYVKDSSGRIITKHDPVMTNRHNASRAMDLHGIETGDGGGFDMQLPNKVYNNLKVFSKKEENRRQRVHDKVEKSTAEMALDPRTRVMLFKLVDNEILESISGVISTGKEAVILHAHGGQNEEQLVPGECAIKVFKTTLNEFKTRDKYIKDDYRFRDRFSKQNPRRMIHMWAEKEMHNLARMKSKGVPVPDVILLRKHILIMSFIGKDEQPAPKLKDANLSVAELELAYVQVKENMVKLYRDCKLVHADLSAYNILWYDDQCWLIDVSQSVEPNHPNALEFLFRDCTNISSFFEKSGVAHVSSPRELFVEITGIELHGDTINSVQQITEKEKNEMKFIFDDTEIPFDEPQFEQAQKTQKSPKLQKNVGSKSADKRTKKSVKSENNSAS